MKLILFCGVFFIAHLTDAFIHPNECPPGMARQSEFEEECNMPLPNEDCLGIAQYCSSKCLCDSMLYDSTKCSYVDYMTDTRLQIHTCHCNCSLNATSNHTCSFDDGSTYFVNYELSDVRRCDPQWSNGFTAYIPDYFEDSFFDDDSEYYENYMADGMQLFNWEAGWSSSDTLHKRPLLLIPILLQVLATKQ